MRGWCRRLAAPGDCRGAAGGAQRLRAAGQLEGRAAADAVPQLPADRPEPTVSLSARPEGDGSWLLEIHAIGFRFTALCLVEAEALPVGHAHVTRGKQKVASAYLPVLSLGRLGPGSHTYRVELRGQDHRALVGRNGLIGAELTISVPRGAGAA